MFGRKDFVRWARSFLILMTMLAVVGCGNSVAVPLAEPAAKSVAQSATEAVEPLASEEAMPPVRLAIPDIGLETDVVPMGWHITQVDDVNTTEWDVPYSAAGWHVTSVGVGAEGNMILSGHQSVGEAVFAQIALGELEEGHLIYLTDEADQTFVYAVAAISDPIPLVGATEEDIETAEGFVAPTNRAQLTLMTGWPDFSTTHYLFVTAEFVGIKSKD